MRRPADSLLTCAAIVLATVSTISIATPAAGQTSAPATAPAADSVTSQLVATTHTSRFGRWGHILRSAADAVEAKTGVSKETAARIAITAATGGAGAALMSAKNDAGAGFASNALATAGSSPMSTPATAPQSNQAALEATTYLSQVAMRASQGDSASAHALATLNATMSSHTGRFAGEISALQLRASKGDATAAQQLMIREADIVRAALASPHL